MNRAKFTATGLLAINPAALGIEFVVCSPPERVNRRIGDVAIVDVRGPLEHHAGGMFDSYDAIKARVSDALASDARAVVLAFDSPGGLVSGVYETSNALRAMAAAARKPMFSYSDGECSSAAYALACAGERIFLPVGSTVGSIGVIAMAVDATAADRAMGLRFVAISSGLRKTDANPHVALTDESVAAMQKTVDAQANVFFGLVGNARGVSADAVRGFQAGIFVGRQAVEVGLADAITTLDQLAANIAAGTTTAKAEETTKMDMSQIRKSLGEGASGDGDEAKRCRAALAALDGGEGDDKDKKDAKAEDGDDKSDDDKKKDTEGKAKAEGGDDKDAKAKAETEDDKAKAMSKDPTMALASEVQSLSAWKAKKESEEATAKAAAKEAETRAGLLAKRPDFTPAVLKSLEGKPLEAVRYAVEFLPKGPTVTDLAGASQPDVAPTLGAGQGIGQGASVEQSAIERMNEKMGLGRDPLKSIAFDGVAQTFRAMTREEASKYATAKAAQAAGAK